MFLPTSLHKNHPGRRTAMTTAPDFSHRDLALNVFGSVRIWGKQMTGLAGTQTVFCEHTPNTHLRTEFGGQPPLNVPGSLEAEASGTRPWSSSSRRWPGPRLRQQVWPRVPSLRVPAWVFTATFQQLCRRVLALSAFKFQPKEILPELPNLQPPIGSDSVIARSCVW